MTVHRHRTRFSFGAVLCLVLSFMGCTEEIDTSARYVFTDYSIVSYLERHDIYSEYVKILQQVPVSEMSETTPYQLLTARGNYTVFAPTNEAIYAYLQDLVDEELISEPSWDAFESQTTLDSIRKVIVKNSIIDGADLYSQRFTSDLFPAENNGEIALPNMNDHKLTVFWPENQPDSLYINGDCPIDALNRDIPAINGVVHQIHKVIAPADYTVAKYLQDIIDNQKDGYLLYARAIQACGLMDTLRAVRDEVYEDLYQRGEIPDFPNYQDYGGDKSSTAGDPDAHAPEHRKYGFTLFLEPDEFWVEQGIDPHAEDALAQMQKWIFDNHKYCEDISFTADEHYSSPENILHQFVTYHMLPMRIPANKLVYHCNEIGYSISIPYRYSIPVYEYYPTMNHRRLLKLFESAESNGVFINRFPILDNGRKGTGHEIGCDPDKEGCYIDRNSELTIVNDLVNACIYPIDVPLAYDEATRNNLGKERIRFDCMSMFPEAMSNDIRRKDSSEGRHQHVYFPADYIYRYLSNLSIISEDTKFVHYNGYRINWANYCQDEDKAHGRFDLMFTLPPVPKRGVYELRYKTLATAARGVVQVYFGSDPNNLPVTGIPIDMTKSTVDCFGEGTVDISDTGDPDVDSEIDHKLRNHGIMKSAKHEVHESNISWSARNDERCTRHILTRQTLDPDKTYYLRFKSVLDSDRKEFYMDYLEWCPKEIYDNPAVPEDIW